MLSSQVETHSDEAKTLKAVYIEKTGGVEVLQIGERPTPKPGPDEILIRVHAASINPRDWLIRSGRYPFQFMLPKFPLVLGSDVSGVVECVGSGVDRFKQGDAVFASRTGGHGGYAEYMAIDQSMAALKPKNMSHIQASAVPLAALTSWRALFTNGRMKENQRLLIIGGSGSCGSFGVQIAKAFSAHVTAVCSTPNVAMVKALGADQVIDYKKESFFDGQESYDIIYDTIGKENLKKCRAILKKKGVYITTVPRTPALISAAISKITPGRRSEVVLFRSDGLILEKIADLTEAGKIRSLIDKIYPFEEVAAAHTYSRSFHTKGKLILTPDYNLDNASASSSAESSPSPFSQTATGSPEG